MALLDQEHQLSTLKLIDERQDQVLEDLNRLNLRIANIIELYGTTRKDGAVDDPTKDAA